MAKRAAYEPHIIQFQETVSDPIGSHTFEWELTLCNDAGATSTFTISQAQAAYKTLDLGGGSYIHYYRFDQAAIVRQYVAPLTDNAIKEAVDNFVLIANYAYSIVQAEQLFGDEEITTYYPFTSDTDIANYTDTTLSSANYLWTDRPYGEYITVPVVGTAPVILTGWQTVFPPNEIVTFYGDFLNASFGFVGAADVDPSGVAASVDWSASLMTLDGIGAVPTNAKFLRGRWDVDEGNRYTAEVTLVFDRDCVPSKERPLLAWITSKGGTDLHLFCGRYEWRMLPDGDLAEYGGASEQDERTLRTRARPTTNTTCDIYVSLTPNEWAWAKYIGASTQVMAYDGTDAVFVHAFWKEAPVFLDTESPAQSDGVLTITYINELMPSS
jgi:hypothetical protein